ncbi:hypothetical protein, partial [Burkholderia cenocepacia]|uniref:hypothetical protein n=1 Tax=Burkholderia cenocepacia TaxID=95486 RepID=UPI001CA461F7
RPMYFDSTCFFSFAARGSSYDTLVLLVSYRKNQSIEMVGGINTWLPIERIKFNRNSLATHWLDSLPSERGRYY